ncbi:hypothetical protein Moror_8599 [Moniliophthora roreri MCA 2997]|uniref:Uncharacterized protein n=1 Tax=Moniliophthora roreri (strain MCA 2997) TaxID=1381753 RepID=V2YDA4_MONRO|nr:hypothetical protein Moror_8599 [Moniliophthora roreri MCA 2997]
MSLKEEATEKVDIAILPETIRALTRLRLRFSWNVNEAEWLKRELALRKEGGRLGRLQISREKSGKEEEEEEGKGNDMSERKKEVEECVDLRRELEIMKEY